MAEERRSPTPRVRGTGFNVREVPVGATVRLSNDATAEVIDNPRDGMWLLCRYLTSPDDPDKVGETEPVFVHDVAGMEEAS
jgi:hypothetical protein